ncbi:MAG: GTP 3',8-cyclase MoaA [bacterium]
MEDSYERKIDYLRVSVTDRCNLRCFYCMPEEGVEWKESSEILRYEEMELIIQAAVNAGIRKVRITGGEPLVRKNVVSFIEYISKMPEIEDISMTTNGFYLADKLPALKKAGLKRVNISLDTLNSTNFEKITGRSGLDKVLAAIELALELGLYPVKVNMVLLKGMNEDDALKLASWTKEKDIDVRYIELMPLGGAGKEYFLPVQVIEERLNLLGKLIDCQEKGNGPALYKKFSGAAGKIGFISPLSNHFCHRCNRMRLTADGKLKPCLISPVEIDIKSVLRQGASVEELTEVFKQAVRLKPERHHLNEENYQGKRKMSQIGG